jgi:hypothetical protein
VAVRRWPLLIPLLLPFCPVSARGEISIGDVLWKRHGKDDFRRIGQYFSPKPQRQRNFIWRTDSNAADGLYAIVVLCHGRNWHPNDAMLELEFYRAGEPEPSAYAVPLPTGRLPSDELWIGLTGDAWRGITAERIVAWQATVRRGETVIARRKSFLFRDPPGKNLANGTPTTQVPTGER